ncbi:MAG: type IV secretory system conjugative DNA transfer family protein [Arthrospira platensis]
MNADLTPAIAAAGGGSLLITGIWLHEHRRNEAMRRSRTRHTLAFPPLTPDAGAAALQALSGLPHHQELVLEVAANGEGVRHALWVPQSSWLSVRASLTGLLPGLRISERPAPEGRSTFAMKVSVPTPTVLSAENPEAASQTLLAGLTTLGTGERVVIRWAVRPGLAPSLPTDGSLRPAAAETHKLWRKATLEGGGFRVSGLVLVQAGSVGRARGLGEHIASCLRSRRGSVGTLRLTSERTGRNLACMPKTTRGSGWLSASELLGITGLPVGETPPGVEVSLTRQVAPPRKLARHGRPLFIAERQGQAVPVALDFPTSLRHVAVLGASGGGKSTLLARGILSHVASGHAGFVLDPKGGDLISAVVDRADTGAERIVVLDPTATVVPGVDLFAGGDPDLRAEVLVRVFRSLFKDAWGPRSDAYIRLGVRTLAEVPDATLLDLPRLFLDPRARRRAVGYLHDPLLVGQWQALEQLSEGERSQHLQAPLSRVMSLITRPAVQAVFGPGARLDIGRLLDEGGWLLVPLPSGTIGADSARIIGSALTFLVWSHIAARAAIAPGARKPLCLFFDETQALTDQGVGLEDLLEQARGFGASVTIATQAIGRVPEQLRHSLLSNAGTLVSFRAGATEAATIARELPGLEARDIQSLPPFHVAARVATGNGSGSVVVTGHTQPLGEPTGQAGRIRQRSAERYGRSRDEVQAAIRERYGTATQPTDDEAEGDIGRSRRRT